MEDSYAYIHCSGIRHSWGVQCGTDFFPNKVHQNFQIKKEDNIFEWMCYKIFASVGTRDLIILWIILGANLFKFLCLSLNLYLLLLFICLSLHFSNSIKLPIQRIEDILGRDYNVSLLNLNISFLNTTLLQVEFINFRQGSCRYLDEELK